MLSFVKQEIKKINTETKEEISKSNSQNRKSSTNHKKEHPYESFPSFVCLFTVLQDKHSLDSLFKVYTPLFTVNDLTDQT